MDSIRNSNPCLRCNRIFECHGAFQNHVKTHHEETSITSYSCSICSLTFNTKSSLDAHIQNHKANKFACDICKATFSQKVRLKTHIDNSVCQKPQ